MKTRKLKQILIQKFSLKLSCYLHAVTYAERFFFIIFSILGLFFLKMIIVNLINFNSTILEKKRKEIIRIYDYDIGDMIFNQGITFLEYGNFVFRQT